MQRIAKTWFQARQSKTLQNHPLSLCRRCRNFTIVPEQQPHISRLILFNLLILFYFCNSIATVSKKIVFMKRRNVLFAAVHQRNNVSSKNPARNGGGKFEFFLHPGYSSFKPCFLSFFKPLLEDCLIAGMSEL